MEKLINFCIINLGMISVLIVEVIIFRIGVEKVYKLIYRRLFNKRDIIYVI